MNPISNPAKIISEGMTLRRWIWISQTYAIGSAVLAGTLLTVVDFARDGWGKVDIGEGILAALVVFVVVSFAFRMARETSLAMARRMAGALGQAQLYGTFPEMPSFGWPLFDQMSEAITGLLAPRDEKIQHLQGELAYYRRLAEDMPGFELFFSHSGQLLWLNPAVEGLTGFSREDCFSAPSLFDLCIYPKDRQMARDLANEAMRGKVSDGIELRIQRKDGSVFWAACRWHPMRDASDDQIGLRFSAQDVQQRKDAELKLLETVAALRRAQALKDHYINRSNDERMRLLALLDIVKLGILFVDRDRRVVYINQPCADIWALGDRNAIVGIRDVSLLDMMGAVRVDSDAYLQHVDQAIVQRSVDAQYDIYCKDGRVVRERSSIVASSDGTHLIGRVWIYEDITETLRTQERLTELAERDPLTGLFNRRRFHEEIERQLAESVRRGEYLGLLSFDLDGFKEINDRFGHLAGDEVLRRIGQEVNTIVRRNELFFRLGGDEFAILVANPSTDNMAHLARRVVEHVAALDFVFHGIPARITVSLGIAMAPLHAHDPEELVLAADRAMYRAKAEGKNAWSMAPIWENATPQLF